jgi:hypothetical protein
MPSRLRLPLLENVTENVVGTSFNWYSRGEGTLQILGVFDGATVELQGSTDGEVDDSYATVTGGTYTDVTIEPFSAGQIDVRAVVTNKGDATDLYMYLVPQAR